MLREDYTFAPTVSEPVKMSKDDRSKHYTLPNIKVKNRKVTAKDIKAYKKWCEKPCDGTGYMNMPLPPWLIDSNWVDEESCPWSFLVTFTNKQQKLMTGMHKAHIQCQVDKEGLTVKTAKKLLNADVMNEEFLVKLKKEILENNERNG